MSRFHPDKLEDAELVAIFQGDPESARAREAVSELFRRYRDQLYLWCFRHMRNHDAAMDLVQETYMAAHRSLPGFEGRSKFSSWLYTIARFRCASARRLPRLDLDDEAALELIPGGGPSPEDQLLEREDEDRVLEFLNRHLEPTERLVFWMRCYEGISVDEINAQLTISEKSGARAVLQRARRKLRAALAGRPGSPGEDTP